MPLSPIVQQRIACWTRASKALAPLLRRESDHWAPARADYVRALAQHPTPDGLWIDEIDMGGVPATVVVPEVVEGGRVLLYLHGGGYVAGSPAGYHGLAGRCAQLLKARVYMPEYRLAPEHPLPAAIDDSLAAYGWLLRQGRAPASIVFSGDSAGGAMVVSVMVAARRAGLPLPAAGAALSPWANLEHSGPSITSRRGVDPIIDLAGLDLRAGALLNGASKRDPAASPVFADVRGLPPILVHVGECEMLLSDALQLATHLAEHRVRVTLEVWPGMFHGWHLFAAELPEGLQALRQMAAFFLGALPAASAG